MIKIDSKTFYKDNYMIYNSNRKSWVCDCEGFRYTGDCKHIEEAKTLWGALYVIKNYPLDGIYHIIKYMIIVYAC